LAGETRRRKAERARVRELDARTVDIVRPGDDASERAHNQKGQNTNTGPFGTGAYRHATDGGWFSWDLKVQPGQPQELRATYWGSDDGRVFDILVDGEKLATQQLRNQRPGKFFDETYPLPAESVSGKEKITVRFQARDGGFAGGVFGLRVTRTAGAIPKD
jgi:hypothetical protein